MPDILATSVNTGIEVAKDVLFQSGGIQALDRTVTFMNDGSAYEITSVKSGESVNAPNTDPSVSGKTFLFWSESQSGSDTLFPYTPLADTNIYARYATIPNEYQEVEYIDTVNAANGYIDTGIKVYDTSREVSDIKVDIEVLMTNAASQGFYGVRSSLKYWMINYSGRLLAGAGVGDIYFPQYFTSGTQYNLSQRVKGGVQSNPLYELIVINRTTEEKRTYGGEGSSLSSFGENTIYLLKPNTISGSDYRSNARFKTMKVYDNSQLVQLYIPCYRKSDSVAGFYDYVRNEFHTNDGTGTWVVGPDVN